MKKLLLLSYFYFFRLMLAGAQIPSPSLIGYWHNWNDVNAPYIQLDQIDARYTVIEVSFAVPTSPSDMTMLFTPDGISQSSFITNIQSLQNQGKKVLISIGGATTSIDLTSLANKNAFITSMTGIITTYGFDGMDIDIENGNSILNSGGTITAPNNVAQLNLIAAIQQIMTNFRTGHQKKMLLTMAPETAYVLGGQSAFGGIWGGYLPIIDALRDSLDILQVQLYNSGSMYGIDGSIYTQESADFIVAMTEAVIHGFATSGGFFQGLPPSKIAVGLPACANAAGGGFADSSTVTNALNYLKGQGPQPGNYTLSQSSGYPTLLGMMTWSINWDAVNNCSATYAYAQNFENIFSNVNAASAEKFPAARLKIYPNPAHTLISLQNTGDFKSTTYATIFSVMGTKLFTSPISNVNSSISIADLPAGIYLLNYENTYCRFSKY